MRSLARKYASFNEIANLNSTERLEFLMDICALVPERLCEKCLVKCHHTKRKILVDFSWRCSKCTKYYSIKTGYFFEHFIKTPIPKVLEVIEYWQVYELENNQVSSSVMNFEYQLIFLIILNRKRYGTSN